MEMGRTGWAMTAVAILALPGASVEAQSVVVRIQNRADVPAATVADAARRVQSVYRTASVSLTWFDDDAPAVGADLTVSLIITRAPGWGAATGVLGFAIEAPVGCGRIAYVFADRVSAYAAQYQQDLATVLAVVIAHELGHLMLPHTSHTARGVMSASWDRQDLADAHRGLMRFSDAEAARMRTQILREPTLSAAR
jgi:hypothetical protein